MRGSGSPVMFLLQVERGDVPPVEAVIDLKPLFVDRPFGLDYLTKLHPLHSVSTNRCRLSSM